jgi:endonuclease YncB( thermonuclease family)
MVRSKWPALLVIVAVSGGTGYYAHVLQSKPADHVIAPPAVATGDITCYDFSKDTPFRVVRVVDGDTVDLETNSKVERVRLIGVDTPESVHPDKPVEFYAKEASLFARNLLEGESVYIREGTQKTDKYGRRLAYLFRVPDGLFVNLEIVRQGYGHVFQVKEPIEHLELFLHYERLASSSKKGVWAAGGGCVKTPEEATQVIGTKCTVEFIARSVWHDQAAGVMFLNSKADYRDPANFHAMIGSVGIEKYRRIGVVPVKEYNQKRIRVTGTVTPFHDKPQIIVDDPSQIMVIDAP